MSHHILRRITNTVSAFLLAAFFISLSGFAHLNNAYADTAVTANYPTPYDLCGSASDSYYIAHVTGVQYQVKSGASWNDVAAGSYPASGTVELRAVALPGYVLTGNAAWTFNFMDTACIPVTPVSPTMDNQPGTANDTYTIPAVMGVTYTVESNTEADHNVMAGTYGYTGNCTVTIRAYANAAYVLTGNTIWALTYGTCGTPSLPQGTTQPPDGTPGAGGLEPQGGGGSTNSTGTPTNQSATKSPKATLNGLVLPDTGANPLKQLVTFLLTGILAYGLTFCLVNGRDLLKK